MHKFILTRDFENEHYNMLAIFLTSLNSTWLRLGVSVTNDIDDS